MNYRICLPIIALVAVVLAYLLPGCDTLVTEKIETTIAGHPTAEFGVDVDTGCAPLTVKFTDLSNGPHDSLYWYFGDGNALSGERYSTDTVINDSIANPVHTYDSAGTYDVTLTIKNSADGGEDTEFKRRFIIVGTTVADFVVGPDSGCSGLEVTFTPTDFGGVTSWLWNFGDSSPVSTDSNPIHVYDSLGYHTVTLTVTGGCGTKQITHDSLIQISDCPTVRFFSDTSEGCVPLQVTFFDSSLIDSTHAIVSRSWDFGNGQTSTEQNPVVSYDSAGTYTVTLTITSTGGTSTDSIVDYITVYDTALAAFSATSPSSACYSAFQQFQVVFKNNSLGDTSWTWRFGDGTISNDSSPVHAYVTPGKYTVILEVNGPCGTDADTIADYVVLSDTLSDSTAFTISPATGDTTTTFTFTDTSKGVILNRQWTIDTVVVNNAPPQIQQTFLDTGWYQISLAISNDCDSVVVTDSVHVTGP